MMCIADIFNLKVINSEILFRYAINLSFILILVKGIYYKKYKQTNLFLTFFAFNSIVFFVSYVLNQVELSTGAAFALFAVFSILRFRTDGISAKDMTYIFLNIGIGLLTAVILGSILDIVIICSIIISIVLLLESNILLKKEASKLVYYDNINLINDHKKELLIADLKNRTGLDVNRFVINEIDFLKDSCRITIFYTEK